MDDETLDADAVTFGQLGRSGVDAMVAALHACDVEMAFDYSGGKAKAVEAGADPLFSSGDGESQIRETAQ